MKLIVGGYGQGKTTFACQEFSLSKEEVIDGSTASLEDIIDARAVRNYHLFLRREMEEGRSLDEAGRRILSVNPGIILIADEIGCGLVPLKQSEREYRDQVGHALCKMAKEAEHVYRVFCGIGRVIK